MKYDLDDSLFDLYYLAAKTKTPEQLTLEALFADDHAIMAHKESNIQLLLNKFAEVSKLFGLTISLDKTSLPSGFSWYHLHLLPQFPLMAHS